MICRNSLQAMGSYQHLIYLGIIEMSVTIFFAVLVVPKFGYQAYCISILTKMDDTWNRRGILVSEENEKNDAKKMNFQVVAECSLFNYNQYIFYVWRILTRGGMLNEKENFFPA